MLFKRDIRLFRLITFDITGTLVKFINNPVKIYLEKGLSKGLRLDEGELRTSFKKQWVEMNQNQPHFGRDSYVWWSQFVINTFKDSVHQKVKDETLEELASELIRDFSKGGMYTRCKGSKEFIEYLRGANKNLKIGIISNFDSRIRRVLEDHGFAEKMFDFIILSHEVQMSKPSEVIFQEALKLAQLDSADEALHFGDNYDLDFMASKIAGWNSILLSEKEHREQGEIVSNSAMIFKDLYGVKEYFSKKDKEAQKSS